MTNIEQLLLMCKTLNFDKELAIGLLKTENLNKQIGDTTLLYQAVQNENTDMVKLLLDSGADPNFFTHSDGPVLWDLQYKSFFEMEEQQQLELVRLLLEYGANPDIEWEYEVLFDYIVYKVFNETGYEDWDYMAKYLIYLVAYGASSEYCSPKLYTEFDKTCLYDYTFRLLDGRGEILKNGEKIADI